MKSFAQLLLLCIPLWFLASCDNDCANKECFNGTCSNGTCDCDPGWFKDADGLCTQTDCGAHGSYDINQSACVCEPNWSKDGSGLCNILDCGPHGTFNTATLTCDCDNGYLRDADGRCTVVDACANVNCGAHGDCNPNTGACDCDPGYSASNGGPCVEMRAAFIGTWRGTWTDDFAYTSIVHDMYITADPSNINRVRITNILNQHCGALNSQAEIFASINAPGYLIEFISLCSDISFGASEVITLVSPTNLSIQAYIVNGTWGRNVDGNYVKQ
jgi:hypothetical protein